MRSNASSHATSSPATPTTTDDDYPGALLVKHLDNGSVICVYRYIFNDRITWGYGSESYERGFCYQRDGSAAVAAQEWDGSGDPPGPWIKEVGTDRYGPGMEAIK